MEISNFVKNKVENNKGEIEVKLFTGNNIRELSNFEKLCENRYREK